MEGVRVEGIKGEGVVVEGCFFFSLNTSQRQIAGRYLDNMFFPFTIAIIAHTLFIHQNS